MSERPSPPPEGQLITAALERLRPKTSVPEAARRAGISDSRWRQIVQGYQMVNGKAVAIKQAPAETIARMAKVVGVTSGQLREAGRDDAANELLDLERQEKHGDKSDGEILDGVEGVVDATEAALREQGRDLDARQKRVLRRHVHHLIEILDEFDSKNNAS